MPESLPVVVVAAELALLFAGAILLWRHVLSPAARRNQAAPRLQAWDIAVVPMAIYATAIFICFGIFGLLGRPIADALGMVGDNKTIVTGALSHLGILVGALLASILVAFIEPRPSGGHARPAPSNESEDQSVPLVFDGRSWTSELEFGPVRVGCITFLIALPLVTIASKASEFTAKLVGLPTERQDLIRMFLNAESNLTLAAMVLLAVVIAPITEELVFRAGLFRYLRTRIPRRIALFGPAVFFGALHVDWSTLRGLTSLAPLVVLAVIFSLAYERTGRIGTPIVAHALFNLNTVLLILGGVTD